MAGSSKTTTDHDVIRKWAEERGGQPATVKRTESGGEPGVLRIDFPGYSGQDSLEHITWEEFFKKFDEKNLAFLYQDTTSSGEESRFFKFVSRETAEDKAHASHSSKGRPDEMRSPRSIMTEDKAHASRSSKGHKREEKSSRSEEKSHKAEHKTEHKTAGKSHKS